MDAPVQNSSQGQDPEPGSFTTPTTGFLTSICESPHSATVAFLYLNPVWTDPECQSTHVLALHTPHTVIRLGTGSPPVSLSLFFSFLLFPFFLLL